jgi:hypothetical protein
MRAGRKANTGGMSGGLRLTAADENQDGAHIHERERKSERGETFSIVGLI